MDFGRALGQDRILRATQYVGTNMNRIPIYELLWSRNRIVLAEAMRIFRLFYQLAYRIQMAEDTMEAVYTEPLQQHLCSQCGNRPAQFQLAGEPFSLFCSFLCADKGWN
jgi:hypothetical protein